MAKCKVTFFYPQGPILTGQELASRLILELLADGDYHFETVKLPVFDRSRRQQVVHALCLLVQVAYVWWRFLCLSFKRQGAVYLNLGQSFKALACDGVPFFLCSLIRPGMKCVISLHGHFFCAWEDGVRRRLFVKILKRASSVVVLGPEQKTKLVELGIPASGIHIVNNTCEQTISAAPASTTNRDGLNLLYLGNLIEAKGYKDYLLALLQLSKMADCPARIRAVLCGRLTATALDRHKTDSDGEAWIRQTIESINRSCSVKVTWVPGAYGRDKAALFHKADIFVYPSRVDAQPIVLIEAMAAGCAVICAGIGEIPAMVGASAVTLPRVDVEAVAEAIIDLAGDSDRRIGLAQAAHERFKRHFSQDGYIARWKEVFAELTSFQVASDYTLPVDYR